MNHDTGIELSKTIPRPEFPRPDFIRNEWKSLNGEWQFSFEEPSFDRTILVPFCYQSAMSTIGITEDYSTVWYKRESMRADTKADILPLSLISRSL